MPTNTMKAIRLHEHGGPEVLRYDEVPIPEPKPGEVLVRVHAVGVNPPDWYVREGMPNVPPEMRPPLSLPAIPGTDVSGVVAAVAADVHGLSVGDEVFGLLRFPSLEGSAYAEYVAAPASDLARKPARIDHVHAAGVPMAGLTAWQFLIELGHDHPSPGGTERRNDGAHQRRRGRRGALRAAARKVETCTRHRGRLGHA
jgi:NADPH:quinone reductase-like Zn-dependent oxidoreductase